jgi:hypothetical protein
MCVKRLSWEASDGKKRVVLPSSTPDLEKKSLFSCILVNLHTNNHKEKGDRSHGSLTKRHFA